MADWNRGYRPPGGQAINLPPGTKLIILTLGGIFLADWFSGGNLSHIFVFRGLGFDFRSLVSLFTYGLFHADLGHLAMNAVGVAILGKVLEPRIGTAWILALLAIGTAAGALAHTLISSGYLIGISAGVGALYGAAFPAARQGKLGAYSRLIVLLSMFFLVVSVLGLILPLMTGIAHIAHLGGFLSGLLFSRILVR